MTHDGTLSRSRSDSTYSTCRFSQLLDLESRAQTRPSSPFTFRLADVREPRYLRGLLWALPGGVSTKPPLATGVPETGVLGLVPPPMPDRQMAPPSGEQARRLDLRIDRLRKRSLWGRRVSSERILLGQREFSETPTETFPGSPASVEFARAVPPAIHPRCD